MRAAARKDGEENQKQNFTYSKKNYNYLQKEKIITNKLQKKLNEKIKTHKHLVKILGTQQKIN